MKIKVTRKAQDRKNKILVSFIDEDGEILEFYDEDLGSFVDEDGEIVEDINNSDYYMQFGDDIMKPSEFMNEAKAQDGAFDDVEELYDELTERGLFTNDELKLLTTINGYSVETLNDALYARHGYHTLSQMLDEEGEDDFEDDNDGITTYRGADFLKKKPSAEILKANKKEYQEKQSKTKEEDKDLKKIGTEHFYETFIPLYKNRDMNTLQEALNVFDDISRELYMSKYFKEGTGDRRTNKYFWKLVDNFATIEIKKVYSTLIDKFDHDVIKDGPTYLKERMQDLKRKYGIIIM